MISYPWPAQEFHGHVFPDFSAFAAHRVLTLRPRPAPPGKSADECGMDHDAPERPDAPAWDTPCACRSHSPENAYPSGPSPGPDRPWRQHSPRRCRRTANPLSRVGFAATGRESSCFVDKYVSGCYSKPLHGGRHRAKRCLQDVDSFDLTRPCRRQGDGARFRQNLGGATPPSGAEIVSYYRQGR